MEAWFSPTTTFCLRAILKAAAFASCIGCAEEGYLRSCRRPGQGSGHSLHNYFVYKYSSRVIVAPQHALSLAQWMFSSCQHSWAICRLAMQSQVSPSQLSVWGLIPVSLSSPGSAWLGQCAGSPGVPGQSQVVVPSPKTCGGEFCSTLRKGRPTQHGQAGFLSGSRRCLRQWQRRQVRRRREVRGTRTPTAMAMAGATPLSGPVGKAAGTQFVHEVKKQPQTHFKHPLAIPWGEMGWIGELGVHSSMMHKQHCQQTCAWGLMLRSGMQNPDPLSHPTSWFVTSCDREPYHKYSCTETRRLGHITEGKGPWGAVRH